MKKELPFEGCVVNDVLNPGRVSCGSWTNQTVDLVAFGQQKLCQVTAILAGDAGDESHASGVLVFFSHCEDNSF